MAAKKRGAKNDKATKEKVADEVLESTKKKYVSTKRPQRAKATKEEEERAAYITTRAQTMLGAKQYYSSSWPAYERTWKMIEDNRPEDEQWRANLPDTYTMAMVKTAQAAFIDSEVVPVFAKNQDDDLMRSLDLRDLYTDIARKGDQKFNLYLARLDAFKLGTGFLFTYFEKDTRVQWDIDKFDPETEEITYTRKTVDRFSDPKSIRFSPYLVLVDEAARADFRATARDCIIIELISRDDAKLRYAHMVGGVEAFDERFPVDSVGTPEALQDVASSGIATTAAQNTRDPQIRKYTFFAPLELVQEGQMEVLHYFCVKPEDSHEITLNGKPLQVKTKAWPSPLPYTHKELPIVPIRYALFSGDEFWGQGIIEVCRADAKAMREHREMMSDRQKISLFSPVFSDVTDEIDQRLLKLKPLSIIRTRGGVPNALRIPGITTADLQITDSYKASLTRAAGIDENMIGGDNTLSEHRYTATAISFMRQKAFLRLKDFQFLYKMALIDEVRLKIKLFEQYYASPLKRAPHMENGAAIQDLALKAKQFKTKVGNAYTKKDVSSTLFTGEIEDIDLDMNVLMPLTPAELITKWSQVIRDITPFAQAGIVDIDMAKLLGEYLSALDVNMDKFRKSPEDEAIAMAEAEHKLLADANTSKFYFENILKDGSAPQFITALHLKRHQQLLRADENLGEEEIRNIVAHIAADAKRYEQIMQEQAAKAAANMDTFANSPLTAQIGAPGGGEGRKAPSVSMSYKDAPDDVKRQIEEAAGFNGSAAPKENANQPPKPMPKVNASGTGKGYTPQGGKPDRPLL